ncbi:unnamed protein product [Penicillium salamii]|uniref:C2H2-type domain-containing protein n=1 Tax=Penicillium salamii TaxID=1612424 RepID=A0A9W4J6K8_9EURO|nr:unnamed protein product [Penicillium salamii]CAG8380698.1 unnamed protein product [Penicillium salamii]CAG8382616.1 unnamed protein product [Penicillium salamii]CAG8385049.1 unnamed protein product [Penicillium salamii]CAG8425379.1 unnamed protein product [Penicillium salamii]
MTKLLSFEKQGGCDRRTLRTSATSLWRRYVGRWTTLTWFCFDTNILLARIDKPCPQSILLPTHTTNSSLLPQTESARSALSAFTCTLCNKSYSRHPEYEAHIGSYDHQHRKRLQDLKQLSRDPNAAEKARRAERKADAEAGLKVIETPGDNGAPATSTVKSGGFKKGGFKSSFAAVKGSATPAAPVRKNVLGDDDDAQPKVESLPVAKSQQTENSGEMESEDEGYGQGQAAYYDPRRPTDCFAGCTASNIPATA